MKKKSFFVMVIALSLCPLFCACKGIDNEIEIKFPQSFDQNDATDLDAIKLYNEALKNFTEQDNYMRTHSFRYLFVNILYVPSSESLKSNSGTACWSPLFSPLLPLSLLSGVPVSLPLKHATKTKDIKIINTDTKNIFVLTLLMYF